jgi:hypothetical protein
MSRTPAWELVGGELVVRVIDTDVSGGASRWGIGRDAQEPTEGGAPDGGEAQGEASAELELDGDWLGASLVGAC